MIVRGLIALVNGEHRKKELPNYIAGYLMDGNGGFVHSSSDVPAILKWCKPLEERARKRRDSERKERAARARQEEQARHRMRKETMARTNLPTHPSSYLYRNFRTGIEASSSRPFGIRPCSCGHPPADSRSAEQQLLSSHRRQAGPTRPTIRQTPPINRTGRPRSSLNTQDSRIPSQAQPQTSARRSY